MVEEEQIKKGIGFWSIFLPVVFIVAGYFFWVDNGWNKNWYYIIVVVLVLIAGILYYMFIYVNNKLKDNQAKVKKLLDDADFEEEIRNNRHTKNMLLQKDPFPTWKANLRQNDGKVTEIFYTIVKNLRDYKKYVALMDRAEPSGNIQFFPYKDDDDIEKAIQRMNKNPEKPSTIIYESNEILGTKRQTILESQNPAEKPKETEIV